MQTEILAGYSLKNKDWAEEVERRLAPLTCEVINYPHWKGSVNPDNWTQIQSDKIAVELSGQSVNVLAKSVGTLIAMKLLCSADVQIEKLVLVGIPVRDLSEEDKEYYKILANLPTDRLLIIQNDQDNHGTIDEVHSMFSQLGLTLKVTERHRDDHEYPYFEDFQSFLVD